MAVALVGLTGGIAAGKSTVAREFERLGVPVVDADQLARQVVAPGTDALAEIVDTFGPQVLLANGSLDRKKLGAIVFQDAHLREKLNAITHPRIARASAERVAELGSSGAPYVLYEAALIVENGLHHSMKALIVVHTDPTVQLMRLMLRDQLSQEDAQARIRAQAPLEAKLQVADFVIQNDGDIDAVHAQVRDVHQRLLAKVGARHDG